MEWLITNAIAALLLPPGIVVVALLAALYLTWRRPPLARGLVFVAVLALYALSTPFVAVSLLGVLEPAPEDPVADKSGQAIVVLGGGIYFNAPEYGGDTVKTQTLVRLRYAAHLHRALKKPVLVTGGALRGSPTPEAQLMKQAMQRDFQVPVQWAEDASRSTLENARATYHLLDGAGVRRVYLVTNAWHMPRARLAFEHVGFTVIAAPTGYATRFELGVLDFLPDAGALLDSSRFFHELIGIGWYHLRIAIGR